MKRAIWICYDLGVRGNYDGLYTWLDEHEAQDCGSNLAFLRYEDQGSLVKTITAELQQLFHDSRHARIYLIHRDDKTKKVKGSFIIGGRKAPPWSGYAARPSPPDEGDS
ncbi:MAG: hypothetical protein QOK48_3468 [Blastocatellia bacterium]|jgi:hypothetical protein|nr:hypothetical protein [Blastocatellia bacterium]